MASRGRVVNKKTIFLVKNILIAEIAASWKLRGKTFFCLNPGWDTFEFDQEHVNKNQPTTVLVFFSESLDL